MSYGYIDLFGKEGMTFLYSQALPENYKIALEGYLAVLDAAKQTTVEKIMQQVDLKSKYDNSWREYLKDRYGI